MEHITSRRNQVVQQFRAAAQGAGDRLLLDGAHLVDEAITADLEIDVVAIGDRIHGQEADDLVRRAAARGARVIVVSEMVLEAISPVRQPSGVVAVARRPDASLRAVLDGHPALVLILVNVQDPGNVGAIIRAADACGATGVIAAEGTADPFGWKALRGAMGSSFRLPLAVGLPLAPALAAVRERGIRLLAAVPRTGTPLPRCALRGPTAIVLGGEGQGVPSPAVDAADERLTIPMRPPVDSLNVAMAAALVAYEARRQRLEGGAR
jgi:RNA methyltransferase, TrmH family